MGLCGLDHKSKMAPTILIIHFFLYRKLETLHFRWNCWNLSPCFSVTFLKWRDMLFWKEFWSTVQKNFYRTFEEFWSQFQSKKINGFIYKISYFISVNSNKGNYTTLKLKGIPMKLGQFLYFCRMVAINIRMSTMKPK